MSTSPTDKVASALVYCRDVTRRRARNFYYGLKLTPEPQRSALYAIYAWMRRADDLVDDAADNPQQCRAQVEAFRRDTDAALVGTLTDDDPIWVALTHTASQYYIPPQALHDMLDGQLEDVAGRRYETFDEVRQYCYRVASTVGLVCINIWGYRDAQAPELAVDRGIAFQLTNILRDYREDFDAGRVYLPGEDFDGHHLTPESLRHWEQPDACRRFLKEQVQRARSFYARSAPLDRMITPACRPTLWAMTTIYHGLLTKIDRFPERVVSDHRLRLSSVRKGMIALRARWRARRTPEAQPAVSKA